MLIVRKVAAAGGSLFCLMIEVISCYCVINKESSVDMINFFGMCRITKTENV